MATINLTSRNDNFSDDDRPEASNRINGLAGSDTIRGNGGNDIIYGNAGNDTLYGGNGNDSLAGGAGTNNYYGGSGADKFALARNVNEIAKIHDFSDSQGDSVVINRDVYSDSYIFPSQFTLQILNGRVYYSPGVSSTTSDDSTDSDLTGYTDLTTSLGFGASVDSTDFDLTTSLGFDTSFDPTTNLGSDIF